MDFQGEKREKNEEQKEFNTKCSRYHKQLENRVYNPPAGIRDAALLHTPIATH